MHAWKVPLKYWGILPDLSGQYGLQQGGLPTNKREQKYKLVGTKIYKLAGTKIYKLAGTKINVGIENYLQRNSTGRLEIYKFYTI